MAATRQQVKVFMSQREQGKSQAAAAAKAGISERTGRRIEQEDFKPGPKTRHWRTRNDPFATVWDDVVEQLASIGDGHQFKHGRQVSAWLGLVPRQHGSGGKVRLYGMTKSGDRYLRTMMLHGARAAICWSRDRDTPLARWINPMIERRGFNKAVVALANKNARIAWHIVANGAHYDPGKAFGSA